MTLPERGLYPTNCDDRGAFFRTLEFVAGVGVQLAQVGRI